MKGTLKTLFGLVSEKEVDSHTADEFREEVKQIPIASIIPNRYQPRTVFNEDKIDELALTIRTHGVIQPIAVRAYEEGKYEIIAGERRFRAVSKLGWDTIPALVKNMTDAETASVALIENLQREELTAIEEAIAYQKLLDLHNLTQEALAQRLGKGQSTVANKLRLLKLPTEVRQALLDRQVTERHARALIPLKEPAMQIEVLQQAIELQLNVKQTEELVERMLNQNQPVPKQKPKPRRKAVSKDMRIAMNTIRQSLQMVADSGLHVASEEEEFDEYYQITIKIPKKK
ncbi:nucleoid occlusion protein [Ectobacillus ponti]|uniref:Nucleoid occlusion protein n=1 Tax=Ectobacillus ponti TaxID=2961894 RepID=A0AA42BV45_9BACI|nr:nucleoid occlusion protein [Ectobacillus ponti]MCP8971218.1 nucleoid occlusion protein [Ectobacillus ponti]